MKTHQLHASELVEDFDLYPRADVDSYHVNSIADAIRSGAELPPIIADAKSRRIVDGFHRRRAYIRVGKEQEPAKDDPILDVRLVEYPSEKEMFIEAMKLNSVHGRNMSAYDRTHAIRLAQKLGIDQQVISVALHIPVAKVRELKVHVATIQHTNEKVPLKLPVRHLQGQEITKAQAEVMPRVSGNQQLFHVNQLILFIESGLLDSANEDLIAGLKKLGKLIAGL